MQPHLSDLPDLGVLDPDLAVLPVPGPVAAAASGDAEAARRGGIAAAGARRADVVRTDNLAIRKLPYSRLFESRAMAIFMAMAISMAVAIAVAMAMALWQR